MDNTCKLILLGNGSVGKSSIIARFVENGFTKVYKQTIGLDLFEKILPIRNEKRVHLQVWDIGGQSLNSPMVSKYIFGSNVLLLCYDVTDPQSFSDLDDWLVVVQKANQIAIAKSDPAIYLVGNKIDLLHLRKITQEAHENFVINNKLAGEFLVSASSGDQIMRCLYSVAAKSCNLNLSEYEMAFTDTVIQATIINDGGEEDGRTSIADQIEKEDMKLQAKRDRGANQCCIMS